MPIESSESGLFSLEDQGWNGFRAAMTDLCGEVSEEKNKKREIRFQSCRRVAILTVIYAE